MSDSTASLRRTIGSATDLQSVVRTMKALAASSIGQYEKSVLALTDYSRIVEFGLGASFRQAALAAPMPQEASSMVGEAANAASSIDDGPVVAIVFGSDQGLVGQFNELVAEHAIRTLQSLPGQPLFWAVGARVHARLAEAGLSVLGLFEVPSTVEGIAPLVGQIQVESEAHRSRGHYSRVYVVHNRPLAGAVFIPVHQRLLPLDATWQRELARLRWPTANPPDLMPGGAATLQAFVREHLFISLFRACAESLASENASRLAAMERADKNIGEMLHGLTTRFHRVRQNSIDDELFDLTAGFGTLS